MKRLPLPIVLALLISTSVEVGGCQSDLSVRRVAPTPAAVMLSGGQISGAAFRARKPASLHGSLQVLADHEHDEHDPAKHEAFRQAVERLFDLYGSALLAAPRHTLRVPDGSGGSLQLRLRRGVGPGGMEPDRFVRLEPTDHFALKSAAGLAQTPGEGVPLAGTLRPALPITVPGPVPPQPIAGVVWAVTAVPMFRLAGGNGHQARTLDFDLYDPHATGRVPGSSVPLAGDYTTPLALTLAHLSPQQRGLRGFLSTRDFASAGLYSTEKPTTNKTPLILVHGLISSPPDFHLLYVRLENDPEVRLRYQIWFFYYPSSLPVPYSAMLLREDTEKFIHQLDPAGTHPALHHAVLVGHSMGGLLCRLAISDGGDHYYYHFFHQPLDELHLTPDDRDLVRRSFYYHACADVAKVVFVSTPHRGSKLAGGLLGNLGRLLVRVPRTVGTRIQNIFASNPAAAAGGTPLKPGSSLDSLTPSDPLIAAINDLPVRPGVSIHSIIGNRGRTGPVEDSSDGVVPYTSSHLTQAESEVIVPAGHTGTLERPETAAEIERILHLNPAPGPRQ